jgi:uncharacterized protein
MAFLLASSDGRPRQNSRLPLKKAFIFAVLAVLCFRLAALGGQSSSNLRPEGYVDDFAHILSTNTASQLAALCQEVDQKARAQIAVVTVSSLDGEPVDMFANDLFTKWGVGYKGTDRGVMILLAVNDRRYRIEVGYGLESVLTDGLVGRFGREAAPAFKARNYGAGISRLVLDVAGTIAQASGVKLTSPVDALPVYQQKTQPAVNPVLPFLGLLILFGLFSAFSSRFRGTGSRWRGGGWGGPWYWGGFGGGGFGGFGGGSSGGGGASGSW